ncbi:RNA polymerase sigma factor SigF [Fodinicola acaciae]|uniref:RNA polymerase sigma factor SigF n=1 Tax=Fodinicola acaciae TaxID=2681555 RepID=UPI0013D4FC38|nr:RNA polymerase sigma factor SigF [Fodinicola acaciae]
MTGGSEPQPEYAGLEPLFAELAGLDESDPRRAELRERLVTGYLRLADNIAARFRNRGEAHDDLVQVARIGLVKAVDRFDPSLGHDFLSYAVPTLMGEVRRYFRDSSWTLRVPRGAKELHLAVHAAAGELSQKLGSAPTPAQLADHLGIDIERVYEGLQIGRAYHPESLSAEVPGETAGITLADTLGDEDERLDGIDNHEALKPLLAALPERERRILMLRFFQDMSQTRIAEQVGISQMQVSRILARTLHQLREAMLADGE